MKMNKTCTWTTEVEILATVKCLKRDIFMFYNGQWQRHSYVNTESDDTIYLDNSTAGHFDAILSP